MPRYDATIDRYLLIGVHIPENEDYESIGEAVAAARDEAEEEACAREAAAA